MSLGRFPGRTKIAFSIVLKTIRDSIRRGMDRKKAKAKFCTVDQNLAFAFFLALSEGFKIQAVEEAVGGGFTEIFRLDVVRDIKVGDGSGDL